MAQPTEHKLPYVIAILAVLGLIAVSFFHQASPVNVNSNPQDQRNIITVTGTKDLSVMPDQAELYLTITTNATSASEASTQNKNIVGKVMAQIQSEGVDKADIETQNVYLNKLTEWDYNTQTQVDNGYQQVTTLKVTVKNLDNVGTVLDAAITGGANGVQNIQFTLTPDAEANYKKQAIDDAAQQAADKAKILAGAAGATLGKVTNLAENSYSVTPWRYAGPMMDMMAAGSEAKAAPTPINPQQVDLSVSVSISYELN